MLVAAAAAQWKVPATECSVDKSVITHGATRRNLRYGEVASAAAKIMSPKDIKLREPVEWKIAGKPLPRLDIPDKVLGKPVFGTDVVLPGIPHASIAQCPVFGGKLQSVDSAEAESMRGDLLTRVKTARTRRAGAAENDAFPLAQGSRARLA